MRSTVACMTVLFVAGFLTGGPREPGPVDEPAAVVPLESAPGPSIETGTESTGGASLRDLRVGFRRLSGPPVGADAGIRGRRPRAGSGSGSSGLSAP